MGWVPPDLAEDGAQIQIKVDGEVADARVRLRPFFDPDGDHLRS
jgi:glycine cleavage system aminomethyltransferase T